MGCKQIVKTSPLRGGTTLRRLRNTSRKWTTRKALEGNMVWGCKTRALSDGNTTRKSTSMSPKKVLSSLHHEFRLSCPVYPSSSDYKSGFGGKFGVAEQKDKSALGWEHHEKVEKHESQKGELCTYELLQSVPIHFPICFASCACCYHYFYILKTTRRDSGANLGCRRTGWMQAQQGGIMWRRLPNIPASRVGSHCMSCWWNEVI